MDCFDSWIAFWSCLKVNIFAILSYVGALCLGGFTIWLGLFTRLNARLSALPLLHPFQRGTPSPVQIRTGRYIQGELRAKVINGGLGPAVITKYEMFTNGKPVNLLDAAQTQTAVATVFGLDPDVTLVEYFFLEGVVITPKEGSIDSLLLKFKVPTMQDYQRVTTGFAGFRLRIEYESLYGDELLFDSQAPSRPPKMSLFRGLKR